MIQPTVIILGRVDGESSSPTLTDSEFHVQLTTYAELREYEKVLL